MENLHLRTDGTIDCEYYIEQARHRRSEYVSFQSEWQLYRPRLSDKAKRHVRGGAAAFALATAAFWATMATVPPKTQAAGPENGIEALHRLAPLNLPMGSADAN